MTSYRMSHRMATTTKAAAPSAKSTREHLPNLEPHNGRCIPKLSCRFYFIGSGWNSAWRGDRDRLDTALRAALTDANLNSVFTQYMPQGQTATTDSFPPPAVLDTPLPLWVTKNDIERIITGMMADTKNPFPPAGAKLDSFAALFVLPPGNILVAPEGFVETSMKGEPAYHSFFDTPDKKRVYYAISAWADGGNGAAHSGWPAWKNVCAALYHEAAEIRTDPDIGTPGKLGWYIDLPPDNELTEVADLAILSAGDKPQLVLKEVDVAVNGGKQKVPIQLLWSNQLDGPFHP
jgi:hypothetical protein